MHHAYKVPLSWKKNPMVNDENSHDQNLTKSQATLNLAIVAAIVDYAGSLNATQRLVFTIAEQVLGKLAENAGNKPGPMDEELIALKEGMVISHESLKELVEVAKKYVKELKNGAD